MTILNAAGKLYISFLLKILSCYGMCQITVLYWPIKAVFLITFKLSVDDYNNDGDGDDWRAASFSVFLIFQNSGQASNYPHQWGRK